MAATRTRILIYPTPRPPAGRQNWPAPAPPPAAPTFSPHPRALRGAVTPPANGGGGGGAVVLGRGGWGAARGGAGGPPAPPCLTGHATAEHLLSQVDPAPSGPAFAPIPVRLIVDAEG